MRTRDVKVFMTLPGCPQCRGAGFFYAGFSPCPCVAQAEGWTASAAERRGIYIASRTRHAEKWRALRDDGCPIVSSWIDEAGVGETVDWQELWDRCVAEASNAAALIVYAENDDEYLKGALVEMGAALGHGVPVFLVMGDRNVAGSAWNHPLVTECESFQDALALAIVEGLGR